MSSPSSVSVRALLESRLEAFGLTLDLVAGADGLERPITSPHVQKTGLALAGFHEYLKPAACSSSARARSATSRGSIGRPDGGGAARARPRPALCARSPDAWRRLGELVVEAERAALPLLRTALPTPTAIAKLSSLLEDTLADRTTVHAVLIDVLGLGILITGESGIGKSECALDLIVRGNRLVADDTVEIRRRSETILIGTCPELTRHHMELRGLGIINVKELFGVASTRSSKRVELVVQLERWDPSCAYERLGLDDDYYELLGLRVPLIRMPVASRAQHRHPHRGGGAQPAAARPRPPRGAAPRRPSDRGARRRRTGRADGRRRR